MAAPASNRRNRAAEAATVASTLSDLRRRVIAVAFLLRCPEAKGACHAELGGVYSAHADFVNSWKRAGWMAS